jgi:hypothetical protein
MAFTYGFYNAVAHDRVYDAETMGRMFDGLMNDGVFQSVGGHFVVTQTTGMNVLVASGRAWFNHTWSYNDTGMTLAIAAADAILPRIDSVILETDSTGSVRANAIKVLTGTPGTVPVAPT